MVLFKLMQIRSSRAPQRVAKATLKAITWLVQPRIFLLGMFISLAMALAAAIYRGEWSAAFITLGVGFLTFLPSVLARTHVLFLPRFFSVAIAFFIFATLFLGELRNFYNEYWWYDIALHSGSALGFGLLGLLMLLTLFKKEKVKASPLLLSLIAFNFALGIGALWEIFEFCADYLFGLNMQKSGLVDTMTDLLVDAGGALIASIVGYVYLKQGWHFMRGRLQAELVKWRRDKKLRPKSTA